MLPQYWIYENIWQAKPVKCIIKLYSDHINSWIKHVTHQKAESLRAGFFSKLENTVNSNLISNRKYAEFSTEWYVLLHYHNPTCAYNHLLNLHQESVPLLQSIFTSLFHPYWFTKSSLQFSLTLPSSIPQQFFTSLFLRTTIPTIYTKNIFPTSAFQPIQVAWRDQGAWESFEDWQSFNFFLFPQSMDSDNRGHYYWFPIAQAHKIGVLQVVVSDEDACYWNGKPTNPASLIPSNYFYYFHTLLIPLQELTFPSKIVA